MAGAGDGPGAAGAVRHGPGAAGRPGPRDDLLRAYAAELCAAVDADRDAARHRLVDHYVRTAQAAARHLGGHVEPGAPAQPRPGVAIGDVGGPDAAASWFAAEHPALLTVLALAADTGLDRHVCDLAQALSVVLHRRGRWHDRAEVQRAAVAAADRTGDPAAQTRAHRDLAGALADLGRFDDAHRHLDDALELSRDDPAGQAWTHYHRDLVHTLQGREADALAAAGRAHDLFVQLGDRVGEAVALTDLGWHHGRLGDHGRATDLCEQALVLHRDLGNRAHEAHTWSCLADIDLERGDPAAATTRYRRALDLFRDLGDPYAEASTLAHLGACCHLAGDHAAAHEHWCRAHALLDGLDPATTDQISAQLATVDGAAAAAFRRSR